MIPAFTDSGKDRENLTTLARSCAGVGSALVTIFTVAIVSKIGKLIAGSNASAKAVEIAGFKWFALYHSYSLYRIHHYHLCEYKRAGNG